MQESGLGHSGNYNAATGTDRDGNAGHGLFQLDPASGAPAKTLLRAAQDPHFAARVAAAMLKRNFQQTGNWRDALAMYNAGGGYRGSVGQAYASSVLSQQI